MAAVLIIYLFVFFNFIVFKHTGSVCVLVYRSRTGIVFITSNTMGTKLVYRVYPKLF